jgi:hypothetical protein
VCSQERAISDTIAALGEKGTTRKREVGRVGGWQPVSGLATICPERGPPHVQLGCDANRGAGARPERGPLCNTKGNYHEVIHGH